MSKQVNFRVGILCAFMAPFGILASLDVVEIMVESVVASDVPTSPSDEQFRHSQASLAADHLLQKLVDITRVPGMAAAVTREGKIIWSGTAGLRNVAKSRAVERQTLFRLASVSKILTATAAAKLFEEDLLAIDEPLNKKIFYLSTAMGAITPQQLATHTSGIPHYQGMDATRGNRHYADIEQAVGVFKNRDLLFSPGTHYAYSSFGYTLLSAVIEAAADRSFLDYVDEEIVEHLSIQPDALLTEDKRASEAYEFVDGQIRIAPIHDYSYSWGGAGFSASAEAIAKFGAKFIADEIVSEQTRNMMLTPAQLESGEWVVDRDYHVGFGWRLSKTANGRDYIHHSGIAIGARSALVAIPQTNVSAAILSNAAWTASIEKTALTIADLFDDDYSSAVTCPQNVNSYQGNFDGHSIEGNAVITFEHGLCIAVIDVENALGHWLTSFSQGGSPTIQMIIYGTTKASRKAVLATHVGLFSAVIANDDILSSTIGRRRGLQIKFIADEAPLIN